MRFFIACILTAIFLCPAAAHAAPCSNPSGDEGDQVYNTTYHVMQYCNGQHWVAMGSVMGQGDNLGNRTADGILDMSGHTIQNLAAPANASDAATKQYTDTKISKSGDTMTGLLSLSAAPTANEHAANKEYVDMVVAGASGDGFSFDSTLCFMNGETMRWMWSTVEEKPVLSCGLRAPETCDEGALGTVCDNDGAIYIGTVDNIRIYAAPSDQPSNALWGNTSVLAGATSLTDGFSNTALLYQMGGYPAASACANKYPSGVWYLPAQQELNLLKINGNRISPPGPLNLTAMGIQAASQYWSSTEHMAAQAAYWDSSNVTMYSANKNASVRVRCVRR